MSSSVEFDCPICETRMVVILPTLAQMRNPNDPIPIVRSPEIPEGWERVEADEEGRFRCAKCDSEYDMAALA